MQYLIAVSVDGRSYPGFISTVRNKSAVEGNPACARKFSTVADAVVFYAEKANRRPEWRSQIVAYDGYKVDLIPGVIELAQAEETGTGVSEKVANALYNGFMKRGMIG